MAEKKEKQNLFKLFFGRYFNVLMACLLFLFIFRPYDKSYIYIGIWQICFTTVLLSSIFKFNHHRWVQISACVTAVPALFCSWIGHFVEMPYVELTYLLFSFIFVFICIGSIIYRVILTARVTLETLRGVICVYFMIAFGFGYLYMLIEYAAPGSIILLRDVHETGQAHIFEHSFIMSELIYYSFVTLLTIGFGDIHAVKTAAQTFTILEGMVGQFYIAILVSRIIAVYSFYSHKEEKEPVAFSPKHDVVKE